MLGHCKFLKYFLFSSQNISHHTYSRKTTHTRRFFKEISMCVCTKCASLNYYLYLPMIHFAYLIGIIRKILVKTIVDLRAFLLTLPHSFFLWRFLKFICKMKFRDGKKIVKLSLFMLNNLEMRYLFVVTLKFNSLCWSCIY